jgi:uncharacterized protein
VIRRQSFGETAARHALLALLAFYRVVLSPFVGGGCRFVPSCSEYAHDAVIEHGALRGGWLALRRLSRCHPLGSYGLDPVPPAERTGH